MTIEPKHIVQCRCGRVAYEAAGAPIACVACYCDDCQAGSRQIEALANASPVCEPDGGTSYVLFRKDRVMCSKGTELLQIQKLDAKSATNRVVATCCNSAIVMTFDDIRHWIPVYRARFTEPAPPLQMRICTKFKPEGTELPSDVPRYASYPLGFLWKLLAARLAMLLRR